MQSYRGVGDLDSFLRVMKEECQVSSTGQYAFDEEKKREKTYALPTNTSTLKILFPSISEILRSVVGAAF